MGLKQDLADEVRACFVGRWSERDGQKVPDDVDVGLGNDAVKLDATVLYADMSGSTKLVDGHTPQFAAEIYKTYLHSAAKIIRSESGVITAYDGDRVMAVFIGEAKNTSAVRAGLKINWAVSNIIMPAMKAVYTANSFTLRQVVGIDTSPLFAARTGIRGANDLVWVGRAANYAAKLTDLSPDWPTYITAAVYNNMNVSVTTTNGTAMWKPFHWTQMNGIQIYGSTWNWRVD